VAEGLAGEVVVVLEVEELAVVAGGWVVTVGVEHGVAEVGAMRAEAERVEVVAEATMVEAGRDAVGEGAGRAAGEHDGAVEGAGLVVAERDVEGGVEVVAERAAAVVELGLVAGSAAEVVGLEVAALASGSKGLEGSRGSPVLED
jgi:hypothetical protein